MLTQWAGIMFVVLVMGLSGNALDAAQQSPLPTPDASLFALEVATEQEIVEAARATGMLLSPSAALREAARAMGHALIAERKCRAGVDPLHQWRVATDAGYVWHAVRVHMHVVCSPYDAAAIARGITLGARRLLVDGDLGVGVARLGEQWRMVVVVVESPNTYPTAAIGSGNDTFLPAINQEGGQ